MHIDRDEYNSLVIFAIKTPEDHNKEPDKIFTEESGLEEVVWSNDTPSQTTGWKEVEGKRIPCEYYFMLGFLTEDELWEHRRKYPRDGL